MHTWTITVSRRSIVIRDYVAFISNVIVARCSLAKYMYCYENLLYVDKRKQTKTENLIHRVSQKEGLKYLTLLYMSLNDQNRK